MDKNHEKHFNLRINGNMLAKFKYVCDYDARSMNGQLLIYIRNAIQDFEAEHGEILLDQSKKDKAK